jgi:ATP-binding cassette subfamily B protein
MAAMSAQTGTNGEGVSRETPLINEAQRPMWRLFGYLGRYRGRFGAGIGTSIANKVLDLMPPLLVAWVIDSIRGEPPAWIEAVVGVDAAPMAMASFLAVLAVLIFFGESAFEWMYRYAFLTLAQNAEHDLRLDAYNALQRREIEFFERHRLGETMSMLNDDVNQLERFLNTGFNQLLQVVVLFVFAGAVLFTTSWQLSLVGLLPVPLIVIGSFVYSKLIAPRYLRVRQTVGELLSRLENNLGGMPVIKSFTAEPFEAERVREASNAYRVANYEAIKYMAGYIPIVRMAIALGFAGVLLLGSYWALQGVGLPESQQIISIGELVLFSMMIQRILWPLTNISQVFDDLERARASARRTFGLLQTPPRITDPADPVDLNTIAGEVRFDDVHFTYHRGEAVFAGLSFAAAPGQTVGIAGPTGAGKSTLIKLLLRFYDPDEGAVRIDGIDVRDVRLTDLRRHIALVSQDVYLFHGTIFENIAYSNTDATAEQVIEAARHAQLHDFVEQLPEGYQTIVGERGIRLSGGQRQRLSIARALLKDAPILVLDEATSSVDTETEAAIQGHLREITAGRTALIIAHRLSTIRHADQIVVLRHGRVAEQCTHEELVERGGVYADLWHVQAGEVEQLTPADG